MAEPDESSNEDAETPRQEADALVRLLEAQSAERRQRRLGVSRGMQGTGFRYGSLVAIVVFTILAVVAMEWMAAQLRDQARAGHGPAPQPGAGSASSAGVRAP